MTAILCLLGIILFLLVRLVRVDNIHFKSGWVVSIVAVVFTIIVFIIYIVLQNYLT